LDLLAKIEQQRGRDAQARCGSWFNSLSISFLLLENRMSVRLLVADDHQVIRTGLASLLAGSDIEIVAEAATGKEAVSAAEETRPDVILLDIRMPDGDGLSTLEKLRAKVPDSRVEIGRAHV
jgi:CheY-like chemotaxis protein